MRILFNNARILTMTGKEIFVGDLIVKNNRIEYVGKEKKRDGKFDRIIDCNKNLLMPGFKNCHTHSPMVFLRSYADDMPLQKWLFDFCIPAESNLTGDDIYHLSKLAFLEYISSGITACFDMYFYPHMFVKACKEIGMRSLITLMPTTYYTKEDMKRMFEEEENDKDSLCKYSFSLHSEYTPSKEEVDLINDLVHEYKTPFFTHISETAREVKECKERRGMSPVEYFDKLGLFDYGGGGFHCIYFDDKDIEIFKKRGLTVVTNPGSNTKLASGICDVHKYLNNGINIAIGTDGAASNNCLDMFKEMMLVSSLSKVQHMDASAVPANEILKMATINGSKCMNLKDGDTLEEGKLADIIMIDLHRPNMQPILNIEKNIVYSGSKENIKMTMIDGKILYEDGKFNLNEDIEVIYQKAQECTDRLISLARKNG